MKHFFSGICENHTALLCHVLVTTRHAKQRSTEYQVNGGGKLLKKEMTCVLRLCVGQYFKSSKLREDVGAYSANIKSGSSVTSIPLTVGPKYRVTAPSDRDRHQATTVPCLCQQYSYRQCFPDGSRPHINHLYAPLGSPARRLIIQHMIRNRCQCLSSFTMCRWIGTS